MRVLQVIHDFIPECSAGSEVFTRDLCVGLHGLGVEAAVFCRGLRPRADHWTMLEDDITGISVFRLQYDPTETRMDVSERARRVEAGFMDILDRFRPDVVHFQHLLYLSRGLPKLARERGMPSVMTLHDYWLVCPRVNLLNQKRAICPDNSGRLCLNCLWPDPDSRLRKPVLAPAIGAARRALRYAPGRIRDLARWTQPAIDASEWLRRSQEAILDVGILSSPSQFLKDKLVGSGLRHPDVRIVGLGIDAALADNRQAVPLKTHGIRFGYVGSHWSKGLSVALGAFRSLNREDAELHLFGRVSPGDQARLGRLGLGKRVVAHGPYANDRVAEVFRSFDVLLVPSVWFENYPIVIREALACGRPVITSDIGGMAESVRDGVDGLHFRMGDASDLAAKMRAFTENPGLLQRLVSGIGHVKTRDECAAEFLTIYSELDRRGVKL